MSSRILASPAKAVETIKNFFTSPSRLQRPWTPESVLDSYGDTPDAIIVAHVMESMAKDFSTWSGSCIDPNNKRGETVSYSHKLPSGNIALTGGSPVMNVSGMYEIRYDIIGTYKESYLLKKCPPKGLRINGVEILVNFLPIIVDTYLRLKKHHDDIKAAARMAEAAMKANEAKWNLAETLLNMRRDENGALVPVTSAESV